MKSNPIYDVEPTVGGSVRSDDIEKLRCEIQLLQKYMQKLGVSKHCRCFFYPYVHIKRIIRYTCSVFR